MYSLSYGGMKTLHSTRFHVFSIHKYVTFSANMRRHGTTNYEALVVGIGQTFFQTFHPPFNSKT